MSTQAEVEKRFQDLYSALAELKREVILERSAPMAQRAAGWDDFVAVADAVSSRWSGPDAVDEIRSQREH